MLATPPATLLGDGQGEGRDEPGPGRRQRACFIETAASQTTAQFTVASIRSSRPVTRAPRSRNAGEHQARL
jgi:hypothetical protein